MSNEEQEQEQTTITGKVPPAFRDRVTMRIKEAKAGKSKGEAANPMITLSLEIVSPLTYNAGNGEVYSLDGRDLTCYLMLNKVSASGKSSPIKKTRELWERLGLGELDETNPDLSAFTNPENPFLVNVILSSKERQEKKFNPVKKEWEPILDEDGQPIKRGYEWNFNSEDILSRSKMEYQAAD